VGSARTERGSAGGPPRWPLLLLVVAVVVEGGHAVVELGAELGAGLVVEGGGDLACDLGAVAVEEDLGGLAADDGGVPVRLGEQRLRDVEWIRPGPSPRFG
jgi:hypothetical protein